MLYSYLPFLVHFLLPKVSTMEIGYWSALLGFSYYFGALLGNVCWGLAADHVGRRPVLLTGVLGSGVLSCAFGFSRHFWMSVALRFVWGLLNTTGVSRTALMEVLDDSNSAQGMVLFSVVSGLARIMGPLVGALSSHPALRFSVLSDSLLDEFPFALPAMLSLCWAALVWVLACLELEETLPPRRVKSLSSMLCARGGDQTDYSMLGSGAEEMELDVSIRPDRVSLAAFASSSSLRTIHQHDEAQDHGLGIELQPQGLGSDPLALVDEGGLIAGPSKSKSKKEKKSLTFNSYVQMKVIDTPDIEYRRLARITEEDTPQFYSAQERDSDYSRSGSYLLALRGAEEQEPEQEGDMDASCRSLVSEEAGAGAGELQRYTNGSELVRRQDLPKDFRELSLWGMLRVLMRSKLVYFVSLTYFFLVLATSALNEVFPLWLVIPSSTGGFGFNGFMLGLALFCSGVASLAMQLLLFPSVAHRSGLLPLLHSCLLALALLVITVPALCLPVLQRLPVLSRVLVIGSFTAMTVAADWALVITYVFINNSSYAYQRATVNGVMQALAFAAMMLAALGGSSFFALCESNALKDQLPWPFHYAVVFWLIALAVRVCMQAASRLHRKIQKVRREPLFPRYAVQMEHFSVVTGAARSGDDCDDSLADDDGN